MVSKTFRSIAKRKKIVDAIVPLMDGDGLKKVAVRDICAAAGISTGSFYHYFKAKDHIIQEMYCQLFCFLEEHLQRLLSMSNGADALLAFFNLYGDYISQWGMYANRLTSFNALSNNAEYRQYRARLFAPILQLTRRAYARGDLVSPRTPQELTEEFVMLLHGCDYEWAKRMDEFPIAAYIHTLLSTYLSALRPSPHS